MSMYFHNHLYSWKRVAFLLNELEFPVLCQVSQCLLKKNENVKTLWQQWQWWWQQLPKIYKKAHGLHRLPGRFLYVSFYKLATIYPCRRAWLFILKKNLNFLYPRMLYAKFSWNWPCSSEVEFFLILSIYFYYFAIIPLEEGTGLLL